jgi:hypothetical protein
MLSRRAVMRAAQRDARRTYRTLLAALLPSADKQSYLIGLDAGTRPSDYVYGELAYYTQINCMMRFIDVF